MPDQFTEEIVYQWQKKWSKESLLEAVNACQNDTVLLPFLLKFVPKNEKTLECGCGLGQWVIYLNRLGYPMAGVEIVPECVAICKNFFPEADVKVGDVRALPYPDNAFGGYISIGVVEHMIEGPNSTIKEMRRVLKPNGVAVLLVPSFNYLMRCWYPLRRKLVNLVRNNAAVRKMLGKPAYSGGDAAMQLKLDEIEKQLQPGFWPSIGLDPVKGPIFIEYKCKKGLLDGLLESNGFVIEEVHPVSHPYIFRDVFGNLFFENGGGVSASQSPELNLFGKFFQKLFSAISPHFFNYIYIYIARKK